MMIVGHSGCGSRRAPDHACNSIGLKLSMGGEGGLGIELRGPGLWICGLHPNASRRHVR